MHQLSESALDARARREARRVGLIARKSRWRAGTVDNFGGFMLIDPTMSCVVGGSQYDLTPEEVIDYCSDD